MYPFDSLASFVTGMLTFGGGAAALSYGLFRLLGTSWLQNKFAKELENFRHEKVKEIEKLKIEVQSLLSGRLKLQDRDFQILPEAWSMLKNAEKSLSITLAPFQQFADLKNLSSEELNSFLDETELSEITKGRIKQASEPDKEYIDALTWKRFADVRNSIADFKDYADKQSVLMTPDLKEKFDEVALQMWNSIISKQVGHQSKDWDMQSTAWKDLTEKITPEIRKIEKLINDRLTSHSK